MIKLSCFIITFNDQMPSEKLVLVTGSAGFIGFHLSQKLCQLGYTVVGLDNLNDYYEIGLKHSRLEQLKANANFTKLAMRIQTRTVLGGLGLVQSGI